MKTCKECHVPVGTIHEHWCTRTRGELPPLPLFAPRPPAAPPPPPAPVVERLPSPPGGDSLAEARLELMEKGRWEKPYGVLCPCCDQRAKVYLRPLHRSMARSLIRLYRYWATNGPDAWVNISQFLSYNVSVMQQGPADRWQWVNRGSTRGRRRRRPTASPHLGGSSISDRRGGLLNWVGWWG